MPIVIVSLSPTYTEKMRRLGFSAETMRVENYVPDPGTRSYYVSPANSLCFMDGGDRHGPESRCFPRGRTPR